MSTVTGWADDVKYRWCGQYVEVQVLPGGPLLSLYSDCCCHCVPVRRSRCWCAAGWRWPLRSSLCAFCASSSPVVTGTTVLLIGIALAKTGISYWGGGAYCADQVSP